MVRKYLQGPQQQVSTRVCEIRNGIRDQLVTSVLLPGSGELSQSCGHILGCTAR